MGARFGRSPAPAPDWTTVPHEAEPGRRSLLASLLLHAAAIAVLGFALSAEPAPSPVPPSPAAEGTSAVDAAIDAVTDQAAAADELPPLPTVDVPDRPVPGPLPLDLFNPQRRDTAAAAPGPRKASRASRSAAGVWVPPGDHACGFGYRGDDGGGLCRGGSRGDGNLVRWRRQR